MKPKLLFAAMLCASTMFSLVSRADVDVEPILKSLSASSEIQECYTKAALNSDYRACDAMVYAKLETLLNTRLTQVLELCENGAVDAEQCKVNVHAMQSNWTKLRDISKSVQPELFYGTNSRGIGVPMSTFQAKQILKQILLLEQALQPRY